MSEPLDEAQAPRAYTLPHHYDWIERFTKLVQRACKLAEPVQVLPPAASGLDSLPLVAPPADAPATARIRLGERGWVWPLAPHLDGRLATISDGVHPRGDMRFRNGVGHRGCDIMYPKRSPSPVGARLVRFPFESRGFEVPPQTRAHAAGPGRVTAARWLDTGYAVAIDHGFGVETAYHHMSSLLCTVGDELPAGAPVGIVGGPPDPKTGKTGLVHLHFDLLIGGKFVNPEPYLLTWTVPRAAAFADA
jgi:hypothetical protein